MITLYFVFILSCQVVEIKQVINGKFCQIDPEWLVTLHSVMKSGQIEFWSTRNLYQLKTLIVFDPDRRFPD